MSVEIQTAPAKSEVLSTDRLDHAMWAVTLLQTAFLDTETDANKAQYKEGRALVELIQENNSIFDLIASFGISPGDWITYAKYTGDVDPAPQAQATYELLVERIALSERRTADSGLPATEKDAFGAKCKHVVQMIKARLISLAIT